MERGDLYWIDFGEVMEGDHRPAKRRPVLVIQSDHYNRSFLRTTMVAILTSNLSVAARPGTVLLSASDTGLPSDSVLNATQLATVNRYDLEQPRIGQVLAPIMRRIDAALAETLGLRPIM
jgi:mRNA interferase MazF